MIGMLIAEHGGVDATEEEEEGVAQESVREMLKPVLAKNIYFFPP